MFSAIVIFELRRRLKMLSTYVYGAVLGGISLFLSLSAAGAFKGISTAAGSERVDSNGALSVSGNESIIALLGLFTVAAVFGQAATQDFNHGTWMIVFTRKIKKSTYVLGRFVGAWLFASFIYLAIPAGLLLGALIAKGLLTVHVIDSALLGPMRLDVYAWPFVASVMPMLFFSGAVFFALAAMTRQMAPVYVGVVVMVLGYLVLSSALGDVQYKTMAAVLDPFGFIPLDEVTRYWTPVERNRQLVPLTGLLLVNRVLWTAVGAAILGFVVVRFRTTVDEQKGKGPRNDDEGTTKIALPTTAPTPTTGGWLQSALGGGWLLFREVTRSPVYWSFVVAGLAMTSLAVFFGSKALFGTATLPVTWQVLELTGGTFSIFSLISITFYSGELVWRERDAGLADIVFATRVPGWVTYVSKVLALFLVATSLEVVAAAAALLAQVGQGYFAIDFSQYAVELIGFGALKEIALCSLAITVQVLVNQKYLGHGAMVLYFGIRIALQALGVEEPLVRFGFEPGISYSDMNHYGHWVGAALVFRTYWYAVSAVLLLVAGVMAVRSRETGLKTRLQQARARMTGAWGLALAGALAVMVGAGGFIFKRTHVDFPYSTSKQGEREQADYEKTWRKEWNDKPQPRITDADVNFDVFPSEAEPRLHVKGTYTLTNKTEAPIAEVLVSLPSDLRREGLPGSTLHTLSIGAVTSAKKHDEKQGLFVFELSPPLAPGATTPLAFDLDFVSTALKHGGRLTTVVNNGTFFNNFSLPVLGYQPEAELSEDNTRKSYGLEPKERMAERDDVKARQNSYIRKDSDFITLRSTVSTDADQLAVVPGTLKKEWTEGNRRFFTYEMDQPILNFFSVLSARYEVRRDSWNDVKLEIYYQHEHTTNLDRMMNGMKDALAYCSESFGPYQHHQARILEFPRYQTFAQSFPNTIPYSEAIGFIARVRDDDPDDIDYPYYVTAHEIAHQWWAHQVVGADVQGATMTSESMAQYSALMVMKKKFGEKKMRRFLKYELDRYLTGRVFERKKEKPLAKNENQQYIHYQKGSLAMYALQHFIGEDRVNAALKKYVEAVKFKGPPYTNSVELVAALRAETPPEYAYLIDDLFETITLYDNRAVSATMKQNAQGSWDVKVKVKAVKYRADEKGEQTEVDFSDLIDVGALDEKGEALFVEPRRIGKGESEVAFTVATRPARVGLDPLNMLVDRTSDDNTTVPTVE
jgi:ABC-type transport system involved in multi-copper enzyme maturation permease subunit